MDTKQISVDNVALLGLAAQASDELGKYSLSHDEFVEFLWHLQVATALPTATSHLELGDLVLACACSLGRPMAIQVFESKFGPDFASAASRLRLSSDQQGEAKQRLWQRLFVGIEGPPRILDYRGQGQLRHWFRVVSARFLLNELRGAKRAAAKLDLDRGELGLTSERDPEFALLEANCREHFRAALVSAIRELSPEQRNSLRCYYIHAMTIDNMAAVLGIHRATAARRVAQAREELLRRTSHHLRQALGANTGEIESVIRLAHAQSSLSVAKLLENG